MNLTSLFSWNVNGIRAVEKKGFAQWVENTRPDILCIQETKAQTEQIPETLLQWPDYKTFFSSAEKKGYSGVGVWTKKEPKRIHKGFGIDRFDSEGRILILEFDEFTLYNIYFPNGKASNERLLYKMNFYDAFLKDAVKRLAEGAKIIVCGDVNTAHKPIDLSRPKENEKYSGFLPEERAWIDSFLNAGFLDTLRLFHHEPELYTWWDYKTRARARNVGWRIDYFFISKNLEDQIQDASIHHHVEGSDHCPIEIKINI